MLKPAVATLVALAAASTAYADDEVIEAPSDVPPAQVAPAPTGRPVYVAPLSQTTQSTFVPQSVALSGPEEIKDFDPSRPIPDGYTMVQRKRKGLIIGGAVTFGVAYSISALVAAEGEDSAEWSDSGKNESAAMWIPVAGPFIQMANEESATGKLLLAGIGGAQLAGAIMLYYGMTSKKPVLVRNDIVGSLKVAPFTGNATGLAVGGRF